MTNTSSYKKAISLFFFFAIFGIFPLFASAAECPNLYRNLSFGSRGSDVIELQNFLIAQGDLEYGNNTGYFGRMTEAAVKNWQAKNGVVSSGTPSTTGYDAVGPRTRAKIASVCGGSQIGNYLRTSPTPGNAPLTVTYPHGGETFKAGDSVFVQWQGSQPPYFISLLGDPSQPQCLSPNENYEQGLRGDESGPSYTIPGSFMLSLTEGKTCRFKVNVQSTSNPSISDQSDGYFTVLGSPDALTPTITSTSAKAAGSFEADAGGEITIYGSNLATADRTDRTRVSIDGIDTKVIWTSDSQVDAKVPTSLIPGRSYSLTVANAYRQSSVFIKILSREFPAIKERINRDGSADVNIIISYNGSAFPAYGTEEEEAVANQSVKQAIQEVLNTLSPADFTYRGSFERFLSFSGILKASGYEKLRLNSDVTHIGLDDPIYLNIPQPTPAI